jgi:hypothetical protein
MFAKGWTKIIIILFLVMLVPLLLDSFGIDIIEGAGPTSGSSLGGVGMKAAVSKAEEDAKKAKAALDKALAEKAKAKTGTAPAANEEAEEDKEIAELFTVNNGASDFAYAYVMEPFFEGATAKAAPKAAPKTAPAPATATASAPKKPACNVIKQLIKKKKNSDNPELLKYLGKLTTWNDKNCK